ncbi:Acetyltransferase (GNAT) family protein [Pseudovibrio axinellae]|uniref:Acetyltransferase (GNAT) family protein n=1 Tax=Pseudovibrio axinellae TaxID=989403 RepID=A0A165YAP9_9HYPH|nr:GNAT family N-acetyltransferase [Pseudovibrio axinellae]KZL18619.1 Acetyltransferase (GNAT) family protein [Pseudovibrio axinellae]SER74277.1 Ribosomal protein S18 acetylase RimI [Pseudovibrio axinellae]
MHVASSTRKDVLIERFRESDRDALRLFLATAWEVTYSRELGDELTKQLVARLDSDDLAGVVPGKDEQVWLLRCHGEIVGSLVCAHRAEVLYIWACYLARDFQRVGLGRMIMKAAVADYAKDLVACVHVLSVSTAAQAFYKKLGFIDCGVTEFEVVTDSFTPARIMQARIGRLIF